MHPCTQAAQNFIAADHCQQLFADAALLPLAIVVAAIVAAVFATLVIKAGF